MGKENLLYYLPGERKQIYSSNGPGLPFRVANVYFINIIKDVPGVRISEHGTLGKHRW